jgi:hypothetical protein
MLKARFRNSQDMFRERQIEVKENTKASSRGNRTEYNVFRKRDFRILKLS